jgi:hypothetical protein
MKSIRLFFLAAIAAACAGGGGSSTSSSAPAPAGGGATLTGDVSLARSPALNYPASARVQGTDPRIGLKPGYDTAGSAIWNLRLVAHAPPSEGFTGQGSTGSDIAFVGKYAIMGNYKGFQTYDISDPSKPKLVVGFLCPTSQGDPTVHGNLLFISGEGAAARNDCGSQGVTDDSSGVSRDRFRGVRIVDISDMAHPKLIKNVQTCRGSHTNTLVSDPRDKSNIYIYVSGYSGVRSDKELPGCKASNDPSDTTSAQYRIEVIQVPLAHPEQAKVVSTPHLLTDLSGRVRHADPPEPGRAGGGRGATGGRGGRGGDTTAAGGAGGRGAADTTGRGGGAGGRGGRGGGRGGAQIAPNPTPGIGQSGCHDITSYPAVGLAGGACSGYGILFDIRDAKNPKKLLSVADSNMSFWHSATFSNDGTKLLFSDEWGGGSQPKCRATDRIEWGGNAIFTLENGQLHFKSYYKMPAAQTQEETCTAHNGSLIPIPGREVMVQAFYQGGITIFDWTDPSHPFEVGFFDRGPSIGCPRAAPGGADGGAPVRASTGCGAGGFWSAYWYNGAIYGNDEGRGIDVWELAPGPYLSQNEIDAAKTVKLDQFNAQEQVHFVWPPSYALARAYLDQLERNNGLAAARIAAVRNDLSSAERGGGKSALATLATQLQSDIGSASDKGRVQLLHMAVRDLSKK